MRIKGNILSANTGLDAIKRAPIVDEETGLKCIRIQDISQHKEFSNWGNTVTTKSDYKKFKLQRNDILIARTGATVGASFLVKTDVEAVYNNGSIRLKFLPTINPAFMYYIMQTKEFLQYIENVSCVATQPNLRIETLLRFEIPDYEIKRQERIAFILSAYDNLIEVNNKRIKVLEQMAENLYKEWFVRFRFPGHETTEFVNGLPKGWRNNSKSDLKIPLNWHYGEFSEIGKFTRGKNITAAEMVDGNIPVISAGIEPSGFHNVSNVKGKNLTISASGANAGYLKLNLSDIWAADCSFYQSDKYFWFAYHTLKYLQPVISNFQCGAAQPHVHPKQINRLCTIIPTDIIILDFCKKVEPIYNRIEKLQNANKNLTKQRDLLLPRLMSGKLEV